MRFGERGTTITAMNALLKSTGMTVAGWLAACAVLAGSFALYATRASDAAEPRGTSGASTAERIELAVIALGGAAIALGAAAIPLFRMTPEPRVFRRVMSIATVVVAVVALFYFVALISFANCCTFDSAFPLDYNCAC